MRSTVIIPTLDRVYMNVVFNTTHWSIVLAAKDGGTAIRVLCEIYYLPVLNYLQRHAQPGEKNVYGGRDAADLTHDFFAKVLQGKVFHQVQREGALFRVYLLGALKHFLADIRQKELAAKRGGDFKQTAFDDEMLESNEFDDAIFDRDWAQTIVRQAIESVEDSPQARFLIPWITKQLDAENRNRLTKELGISETAIKVALHRLRKKFGENIRIQIAHTVAEESEIDAELNYLLRVLRSK